MFDECDVTGLTSHLKRSGLLTSHGHERTKLPIADVIALRSCSDVDFRFLFVLLQNGAMLSDYVITSELDTNVNDEHVALMFLKTVFRTTNERLKSRVQQLFFEFSPQLLQPCLKAGVDPTQMTSSPRLTCDNVCDVILRIERRSVLEQTVRLLIRSANNLQMLRKLALMWRSCEKQDECGSKQNSSARKGDETDDVLQLLKEADSKAIVEKKMTSNGCESDVSEQKPSFNVETLQQLCRETIRYSANVNMLYAVKHLPLPKPLTQYLLLQ